MRLRLWRYIPFVLLCSISACTAHAQTLFESVGGGVNNDVRDFALNSDSTKLITVGKFAFTRADSLRANGVAQWDGASWDITPFAGGNGDTINDWGAIPIFTVELFRDTLFVSFSGSQWQYDPSIGGATYLANGVWHPCGNPINHTMFLQENGRLFTGDQQDTILNVPEYGVHEWVDGAFEAVPNSPFTGSSLINASTYWHGQYYFGGMMYALGSRKIIAYDGDSTWSPLDEGIYGNHIQAIEGFGDSLYVGGFWSEPSNHIAIWDGSQWLPFFPEVHYDSQVTAFKEYDGALYITGVFHFVGDTTHYLILRWDGHELCALGGPLFADGWTASEVFQNALYLSMHPSYQPLLNQHIAKLELENIVPSLCVVPVQTGVTELLRESGLSVYPNPANGSVNVSFPGGLFGQQVVLTNALGQVVIQERASGIRTTLSLEGIAPGIYNVIGSALDQRFVSRLVIQ